MPQHPAPRLAQPSSARRSNGPIVGALAYLGGLLILALSIPKAVLLPRGPAPKFLPALVRQLDELFQFGLPLVALVHVPVGTFLAMQAFYSATFTEAVGAVVGLGLLRNMAPMMTGLTLAGLCAVQFTPSLRSQPHAGLDDDPHWVPDRAVALGREQDPRTSPEPARLAAVRIVATMIVGPIFVLWGTVIGTLVGMGVARSMLGVSPTIFFGKISDMILPVDALGLVVKGTTFAFFAALLACHEGLRSQQDGDSVRGASFRAACFAMVAVLAVNSGWFTIAYLSGSPYGPALATG